MHPSLYAGTGDSQTARISTSHGCRANSHTFQGLCGQFNERIAEYIHQHLERLPNSEQVQLAVVGSRLLPLLKVSSDQIVEQFTLPTSAKEISATVQDILLTLEDWQRRERIGKILLFYNQPGSGYSFHPDTQQLFPLDPDWLFSLEREPWSTNVVPTFTINWQELFSELISQYLFVSLYRVLAAMQSAQKNIEERLDELNAQYRRQRQSAITSELLDVVTGFEALTKD